MTASSIVAIACLIGVCLVQAAEAKGKKYQVSAVANSPFLEPANSKGKNSGLIIDILEAIKNIDGDFNYSLKELKGDNGDAFDNGTTTGVVNAVVSGAADFAAGDISITKSRSRVLDFSVPYFQSQYRLLVNSNYNPASVSYFTYNSAASQNFLKNWVSSNNGGAAKKSESPSANIAEAVQKLLNSKSSLALVAKTPLILVQYQAHKDQLKLLPDVLSSNYLAFGVKQGNSALREKLGEYVNTLAEKGTLQDLTNKYIPSGCGQ